MKYGLIGEKLGHSLSPEIHALFGYPDYELRELRPDEVGAFLTARDFAGINVTIPYKQTVIPYLDGISERAAAIGAVNTIVKRNDGSLFGDNTDFAGFVYMLRRAGIDPAGKKVLLLGNGGTSRTAAAALASLGAREILVVSRHPGGDGPEGISQISYADLPDHADAEILVNTTPAGMYPNNGTAAADLSLLPNLTAVADVVYNPLKTALLLAAEKRGLQAAGGLAMLAAQAFYAEQVFETAGQAACGIAAGQADEDTGSGKIPVIENVVRELMRGMRNLVLIGMPGSGKSSAGRAAAERLGRAFIDLDAYIEEKTGRFPGDIITEDGETAFRDIETACCAEVGKMRGLVIAAGGGTPLREENRDALRQNGTVFLLTRDASLLPVEGRPLSRAGSLAEMERKRMPFYKMCADYTAANDGPLEKTVDEILSLFENCN